MTTALTALAERCEAATGPDRELDCRIAAAAHPTMAGDLCVVGPPTYEPERYFSHHVGIDWIGYDLLNNAPTYTASLDAAMTLVPRGYVWAGGIDDKFQPLMAVALPDAEEPSGFSEAATPALALCAASLRALAGETDATE
jgi:hypothetical protein